MPIAMQKTPENESKGCLVNCSRGREGRSQLGVLGDLPSLLEFSEWLWPHDFLQQAWIFTSGGEGEEGVCPLVSSLSCGLFQEKP